MNESTFSSMGCASLTYSDKCSNKPRRTRRKEARPQELLRAGLDQFVTRGFAATRLTDVAAAAGVSKATVYLYFPSKEDLFKAVVREHVVPVLDQATALAAEFNGPAPELLRQLAMIWWCSFNDKPIGGLCKLMTAESANFPELAQFYFQEVIARGDALLNAVLEKGIAEGDFRPDLDCKNAIRVIMAPLIFLQTWQYSFGQVCPQQRIESSSYLKTYLDLILDGLKLKIVHTP